MNITKHKKNLSKGFTLIELLVSVALFAMVFVAVSAAFISVLNAYQKVTATRINVDNLSLSLESMVRGARTGISYHCGSGDFTLTADCLSGDTYFAFSNPNVPRPFGTNLALPIVYKFVACPNADPYCGRIQRSDDGGISFFPVTVAPPELNITYVRFYVQGATPYRIADASPDVLQPQVIIVIKGTVGVRADIVVPFGLQTTITQRKLDIEI